MAETPEQPAEEGAGAPGTELGLAAGNVVAFGLTLLGGLWVWLAVAIAAAGAGLVAWRVQRRRQRGGRSANGASSGRGGTSRSSGGPVLGRSNGSGRRSSRGASGGSAGRVPGRAATGGAGRRSGRKSGRGVGAASSPAGASKRTGGLLGRGKGRSGSGRSPRGGTSAGRRGPAWLGLGKGGRKSGTGRAGTGRGTPARKSPGRGSTRRTGGSRWRPSTKGDVVNTPNPKKAAPKPATKKPATTPKQPTAKTASGKPQPQQQARPSKPAEPHPYRNPTPGHTTKGNIMASVFGRRWRQNAEEIHIQAIRYDPERMPDYLDDLADMTVAFEEESKALGKIAAVSESELPVDPRLVEYIVQTQATMRKVAEDAREVVAHFKKLHENELARHEVRRRGEEKWNVQ